MKNLINHSPWVPRDNNFGLGTYGPIRIPITPLFRRGGKVLQGLVWVGHRLTFYH